MREPSDATASIETARWLLAAWVVIVAVSALGVDSGGVWAAETALPVFLVAWLAATARSFPLSRLSYALVFVFLALHQIGAHFTYPEVPLPAWLGFDAGRNPYDRIVHFAFGLLFTYPLREVAVRMIGARGFWREALPVNLVVVTSVLYEFIEWFFAAQAGGEAGDSVLGAQGDPWDTHWDLLLATAGSLTAVTVIVAATGLVRSMRPRDGAASDRSPPQGSNA